MTPGRCNINAVGGAGLDIALYTRPSARIRSPNRENAALFDSFHHAAFVAPLICGFVAMRSATT
jgi:hypothetical protein